MAGVMAPATLRHHDAALGCLRRWRRARARGPSVPDPQAWRPRPPAPAIRTNSKARNYDETLMPERHAEK